MVVYRGFTVQYSVSAIDWFYPIERNIIPEVSAALCSDNSPDLQLQLWQRKYRLINRKSVIDCLSFPSQLAGALNKAALQNSMISEMRCTCLYKYMNRLNKKIEIIVSSHSAVHPYITEHHRITGLSLKSHVGLLGLPGGGGIWCSSAG